MRRAKREALKQRYESLRQERSARSQQRAVEQVARDAACKQAFSRPVTSVRKKVEDWIEKGRPLDHPLLAGAFNLRRFATDPWPFGDRSERLGELFLAVADKAPKLITSDYMRPLVNLDRFTWVRDIADWEPEGKSRDTIFRSLVEHLLSEFKTPQFLWSAFFTTEDLKAAPIVDYVAKGGSLYDKVKSGDLPVPFTRKMCHEFLQTTADYSFMSGLRRTQIRTYGGSPQLFRVWMNGPIGARLHASAEEEFWATVLQFFAKNPLIDYAQVGPLIDYIQYRHRREPEFTMKGRTVLALMRGMHEWHGDLAKERAIKGKSFEPSGFLSGDYERIYKEPTGHLRVLWKIREILTSKELAEEGRALKHCVYSYAYKIGPKTNSIWSMRANDERVMTIQVDNLNGSVVQYRGKFNAIPGARDFQILKEWADSNALAIGRNGYW